jgi:multiple sugar transport system ATP-binding protein
MNFIEVGIKDGGALWADTAGFRVKIPADRTDRLKSYVGQPVTIGIRPEDLHPATGGDAPDSTFDAVVEVVEPLGSEILLDVKVGANSMVARVDPTVRVKVHEPIRLALNAERLHFFDKKSEVAI